MLPPSTWASGQVSQRIIATTSTVFYVDPGAGNDSNDCTDASTPCKTMNGALGQGITNYDFRDPGSMLIQLADGVYPDTLVIAARPVGAHAVTVQGNCSSPDAVFINPTNPTMPDFWIEDGAIAIIDCVRLGGGGIGIAARQYAIVDANSIDFSNLQIGISITDTARINVANEPNAPPTTISGNMAVWGAADNGSSILVGPGVSIAISQPVTVRYMMQGCHGANLYLSSGVIFRGAANLAGQQYSLCQGATLYRNGSTLPGTPGANFSGVVY